MRPLLALAVLLLCACAGGRDVIPAHPATYPATHIDSIKFHIDSDAVKSPYQVIAIVRAELESAVAGQPVEDGAVIGALKARAAELGADGIILEAIFTDSEGVSVNSRADYVERKRGRALAIKFDHR